MILLIFSLSNPSIPALLSLRAILERNLPSLDVALPALCFVSSMIFFILLWPYSHSCNTQCIKIPLRWAARRQQKIKTPFFFILFVQTSYLKYMTSKHLWGGSINQKYNRLMHAILIISRCITHIYDSKSKCRGCFYVEQRMIHLECKHIVIVPPFCLHNSSSSEIALDTLAVWMVIPTYSSTVLTLWTVQPPLKLLTCL